MKILIVTRGYPQSHNSMMGLFEKDQALALKQAGHDIAYAVVDIRSIRRKRKFGFNHFTDENGLEIFEMNWPIGPMPRPMMEYFRQEALIKLYPYIFDYFGKPDIIHAHFLNYAVISVKLAKKEGIPLVITEHSSYLNADTLTKSVIRRAKKAYSAASAIISVSDSLAKSIKEKIGFDSIVISNIASVGQFGIKKNSVVDINRFEFASSGLLLERKGFDVLLSAFSEVVKTYPFCRLTIYGDGPEKRKLLTLTKKLQIENSVEFYGAYKKEEIAELYSKSDAFVLASRRETFGVVYIEAMSVGLPVIATVCGGPENFVTQRTGYLVEKNNVQQLRDAMLRMIEHRTDFNAQYIMDYVRNNFSASAVAAKITQVYEQILD